MDFAFWANFWPQLLNKKSITDLQQPCEARSLDRSLGLVSLVGLGIGVMIGAGIFVITGQVAAYHTGPAIVLSLLLAALSCGCVALCYAEFAALIPLSGSAYTYAYATLGEIFAWIIGWDLVLEYLFSAATVAVGWSGYLVSLLADLGLSLPSDLCRPPLNLPALGLVGLVTLLLILGTRRSTQVNLVMVTIKLAAILLFIGFGLLSIHQQNWLPFIPPNTGEFGVFGWSGVLRGAGMVFFAYIGFDALANVTEETQNPQRTIPLAILISLLIATLLYGAVSLVMVGIVPYAKLGVPDPIAIAINAMGPGQRWFGPLIKLAAIAGLGSVVLVNLMAQARLLYSMAGDGLLPSTFAQVHPRWQTPHLATLISGMLAMVLAVSLPIKVLGNLVSIGTLFAFTMVAIAVLVLRHRQPDLPRPFRVPFGPWLPLLGVGTSILQMLSFSWGNWFRLIGWLLLGLLIYLLYGRRRSLVNIETKQSNLV